jgi:hypothetical protein
MSEAQTDFWHVQLLNGEVRYWSLDELDEAFQRSDVDGTTFVLKQGDTTWVRLGELLGLDESESAPPPSAAAASLDVDTAPVWSIRPVVADLDALGGVDIDEDMVALKPKRTKLIAIGASAAAVLTLAIAAVSSASGGEGAKAAAAAPPPVVAPAPQPVVEAAPAALSDDMKKALLDADKARAAKSAEKAKARAAAAPKPSYRAPKSGQVFHKGGNKYDPLNSQE